MGRRDLTSEEREAILREVFLISNGSVKKRLPKGFGDYLAGKYNCHVTTIRKVIKRAKEQGITEGNMMVSVANKKKGNVGRKPSYTPEEVKEALQKVPLAERLSLRSISAKTGISLGTLHRYLKHGLFCAHLSAIRPVLTDSNKYSRLKFALSMVTSNMQLDDMLDCVHLDEKWFYLTQERRRFYLVPGECKPVRSCKNKRYITKVMFLSAVARPRYIDDTDTWWDGKIGTWPFVEIVPAARSSVNRPAGTPEMKSVSVIRDVYRSFLIEKVLPAILDKWPNAKKIVKLQQDNAPAHVPINEPAINAVFNTYASSGWQLLHLPQPLYSPDMYILDLGFFAAI
ncbi:Aste57867_2111 [Aphanomyces stellatus]|uniref:Aste57867_2111 protein n=1 Tax=Aphanomyces stellatus TaxID=120398 RepID=A0A485KCE6_9STRA|nr:hypothetical protein As57867_002106 [Aphanomyces stellatus]VFT79314.1 Aste57867_2111 [Aphanomyces stellatus]